LALKDDKAVIDGVMWKGTAAKLTFRPEEGLEVICTGKLTTYPARSNYQIVIDSMEPAGEGALMAMLEARKKALAAEGLFAEERKRSLPHLPTRIGVVTSPTGAVIRDILHRLADRFPRHVLVWPVRVQGEGAAGEVAAAIQGFNALEGSQRPDLLIVARGGGSLEDLWAFNEEVVVRAAAASDIPLISAVGHETDTTLIDYASDRRAPTPTAAAEMAVPVRAELLGDVKGLDGRRVAAMGRLLERRRERLTGLARGLPKPDQILGQASQRLDQAAARLPRALQSGVSERQARLARVSGGLRPAALRQQVSRQRENVNALAGRLQPATARRLQDARTRLAAASGLLNALSYQGVLARGFALVRAGDGTPIRSSTDTWPGLDVSLEFADGAVGATIEKGTASVRKPKPTAKAKTRKTKPKPEDDKQGTLL
ncbi:MAG: exodeoxyribonuclease VII large subunit, partial [Alphaproteobacteria bacterium]